MLKLITGIMVSCTVVLCGTRVFADMIVEPWGENANFYEQYRSECELEYNVRNYSALTDFDIYQSPVDDKVVRHVQKGDVMISNTFYTDSGGVRWAYDYNGEDAGKAGWYKMENVEIVYDSISFEEEHKDEFTDYKGQLNDFVPQNHVILWTYPGSGEIDEICSKSDWFSEDYVFKIEDLATTTYIDEDGNEWVYISYFPKGWVNLSNIEGESDTGEAAATVSATVTSAEIVSSETASREMTVRETTSQVTTLPETTLAETTLSDSGTYSEKVTAAETQRDERIYVTTEAIEEASEMVLAISNIPEPPTPDENEKPNFMLPIVLALCAAAAAGGFLVGTKRKKP